MNWKPISQELGHDWRLVWTRKGWSVGFKLMAEEGWHTEDGQQPTHWMPLPEPPK